MRFSHFATVALALPLAACGGKTDDPAVDSGAACGLCVDASVDAPLVDGGVDAPRDTPTDATADATTDVGADVPSGPGAVPPPRPSTTATGGTTKWFVMKRLYLGLTDRDSSVSSPSAWKQYGFDLDHRTTTAADSASSSGTCKRVSGSPSGVLEDGALGRDNSFGAHFMQTLKSLKSDIEDSVNSGLVGGTETMLFRLDNVAGDDNASVPGAIYRTGSLSTPPRFDGSDRYPVDDASVTGSDLTKPVHTFASGYMAGGVWVSGDSGVGTFDFPLVFVGAPISLSLKGAVVVFRVSTGKEGTFAGLVTDSDFRGALTSAFESFGVCPGSSTFDAVVHSGTDASDLVAGAPDFQDTAKTCDSISLGVGFDVAPAMAPTSIVPTTPTPPSTCP